MVYIGKLIWLSSSVIFGWSRSDTLISSLVGHFRVVMLKCGLLLEPTQIMLSYDIGFVYRRTDGHGETSIPPYNFVAGGIKTNPWIQLYIFHYPGTSNHITLLRSSTKMTWIRPCSNNLFLFWCTGVMEDIKLNSRICFYTPCNEVVGGYTGFTMSVRSCNGSNKRPHFNITTLKWPTSDEMRVSERDQPKITDDDNHISLPI
jgi:hypothetical protein